MSRARENSFRGSDQNSAPNRVRITINQIKISVECSLPSGFAMRMERERDPGLRALALIKSAASAPHFWNAALAIFRPSFLICRLDSRAPNHHSIVVFSALHFFPAFFSFEERRAHLSCVFPAGRSENFEEPEREGPRRWSERLRYQSKSVSFESAFAFKLLWFLWENCRLLRGLARRYSVTAGVLFFNGKSFGYGNKVSIFLLFLGTAHESNELPFFNASRCLH